MSQIEDIQIVDIEAELANLWEAQKEGSRSKACLFNLVVYSPEQRRLQYLQNMVQAVVQRFPCRIIFIQLDPNPQQNFLHVNVSNQVLGSGETSFACDQIMIDTSLSQVKRVPFILLPHLVADLPIYLIWGEDPTSDKDILPFLEEYGARLIFDSDNISDLPKFSRNVLSLMKSWPMLDITDLNWVLIYDWRNVLSKVFDTPEAIQRLKISKGIQIRFNDKPDSELRHADRQATYLTWWLATQLQWEFRKHEISQGRKLLTFFNGMNEFVVTLWPETHHDLNPGTIVSFEDSSNDDHFYFISPMEKLPKVTVHISTLDTCDLPFSLPLPSLKRGFPAINELFYGLTNGHYHEMLKKMSSQISF